MRWELEYRVWECCHSSSKALLHFNLLSSFSGLSHWASPLDRFSWPARNITLRIISLKIQEQLPIKSKKVKLKFFNLPLKALNQCPQVYPNTFSKMTLLDLHSHCVYSLPSLGLGPHSQFGTGCFPNSILVYILSHVVTPIFMMLLYYSCLDLQICLYCKLEKVMTFTSFEFPSLLRMS